MRDVIVHYHIFKNAGSSIDASLSASFGDRWAEHNQPDAWADLRSADLAEHLAADTRLRALSSHQARWPHPVTDAVRTHPIVFVRHPVDRIGSVWAFLQRTGDPLADGHDLRSYVAEQLGPSGSISIRSFQTWFLSDDDDLPPAEVAPRHLAQAIDRLDALPTFGVVERFGLSIQALARELGGTFPELVLDQRHDNATPDRPTDLAARLVQVRDEIGPRLYRKLLDDNEADLLLYQAAVERFAERAGSAHPRWLPVRPPAARRVTAPGWTRRRSRSVGLGR